MKKFLLLSLLWTMPIMAMQQFPVVKSKEMQGGTKDFYWVNPKASDGLIRANVNLLSLYEDIDPKETFKKFKALQAQSKND